MGVPKKAKRKKKIAKVKQKRQTALQKIARNEKKDYLLHEAEWFRQKGEFEKAVQLTNRVLKLDSTDSDAIHMLGRIGRETGDEELEVKALTRLYQSGQLTDEQHIPYCYLMVNQEMYDKALPIIQETLALFPQMKLPKPKTAQKRLRELLKYVENHLSMQQYYDELAAQRKKWLQQKQDKASAPPEKEVAEISAPEPAPLKKNPIPSIKIEYEIDTQAFDQLLTQTAYDSPGLFNLLLTAHKFRLMDSFEQLICLPSLTTIRSLWYQEETARKILKYFRGRALLADEVGLGKTIEAGIVLAEYIQRRMVKTVLILTPTPLVSQWRDELTTKFGLSFVSTDDSDFKKKKETFWQAPYILASINIAKSKKNFDQVISREYDLVIVDEAHHLKNKTTLNWKLVNQLKKRFLLLLTATPVENNLLELYNLVTLLKPGQLGTATDFKKEFMTRGDPTDPQNRNRLRGLLSQVMIRNTRAVAKIDIPPRFAETIRIEPTKGEKNLYQKIIGLAAESRRKFGASHQRLFKTLLEEAGSSPEAVKATLAKLAPDHKLFEEFWDEITVLKTLCKTVLDTRKNQMLLKLIQKNSGKMLVFVKYRASVDHLAEFLEWNGIAHVFFHGSQSNAEKDAAIKQFREEDRIRLLISTEIGGEGRNMQFCHQMVNYDLPWNPMKIEQRIGRLHRLGQEKEVRIFNFCATQSLEDYILEILDKKINMFEMVIGEIDMILGRACKETDFGEMAYDLYVTAESEQERHAAFNKLGTQIKRAKTGYEKTKNLDNKLFGEDYEL